MMIVSLVVVWIIGALSPALYDPEVVIDVQVQVFNLIPVIALTLFFIHSSCDNVFLVCHDLHPRYIVGRVLVLGFDRRW